MRKPGALVRRRLLNLLPRLGLDVVDVAPGTVALTRRRGLRAVALDDGGVVLTRSARLRALALPDGSAVVTRSKGLRTVELTDASTVVTSVPDLHGVPVPGAGEQADHLLTTSRHGRVLQVGPTQVLAGPPRKGGWLSRVHENALYDAVGFEHVLAVLRHYRANCVLDVGANKGQYARKLRAAGYGGWIVSFEPVAADFAVLAERAEQDPRWTVHQLALGREDGSLEMNVVPGTLSSLLPPTTFGAERYTQLQDLSTQTVRVRRLDDAWDEVTGHVPDCRPYLKMDTQGFDLEVFGGLGARVEELVGMQSEVALLKIYEGMPTMTEALDVYGAAGFEVSAMFPVSRERRTGRVLEFDCFMVREAALPPGR